LRRHKLYANTVTSIVCEVVTIVCGILLPRYILLSYGSDVNGLVNSVKQFLLMIAFLELGVGSVIQSALYGPLAAKDDEGISRIYVSGQRFFRTIAKALLVYVLILSVVYPLLVKNEFGTLYTVALILITSISYFFQYYFGITEEILFMADQRGYVRYLTVSLVLILNTAVSILLIKAGCEIHVVLLASSIIYLLRPIVYNAIARRFYRLDKKVQITGEPIKQKWNGIAQHVASVVLENTDTIVLTAFSTLSNVSIYAVYYLVISGIKQLFSSMLKGFSSLMGDMWAKGEKKRLEKLYTTLEWANHNAVILVWSCVISLIVPFILCYTRGVEDADYNVPLFAFLISLAYAFYCLRLPYIMMIFAAGHYKQTQKQFIVAAALNLGLSVLAVHRFGLVGVAVGTLAAMVYQTVWMARYNLKNLIQISPVYLIKLILMDAALMAVCIWTSGFISISQGSYFTWALSAIVVTAKNAAIILLVNLVFYRERIKGLLGALRKKM